MTEEFYEHNVGDHEDPVGGTTWLVGIVSAVILAATFLGLTALFYASEDEEVAEKLYVPQSKAIAEMKAEQNERLNRVFRVSGEPDRYIIPIESAIDEYVKDPYASSGE